MDQHVAEAILSEYPHKKINGTIAAQIVRAWAAAKGYEEDRWGNFHRDDESRIKLTKQRVQTQRKFAGDKRWSNIKSVSLIGAAQRLVKKAAEALGDDKALAKVSAGTKKRRVARERRSEEARKEQLQRDVLSMVAKVVSSEMPMGFVRLHDTGAASPEFQTRYNELVHRVQALRRLGRPLTDQDMFSTFQPPLAPLLMKNLEAVWIEDMRGVPYTVSIRNAGPGVAVVEIGSTSTKRSMGTRVDPVTGWVSSRQDVDRIGDAYVSGRIRRTKDGPVAVLYFIISKNKQQGAGSRVLDLWCNLMASYGIDAWVAEAVGDEGQAFLGAKVQSGRLEEVGRQGSNIVMRCLGGPEGRQPMLPGVPLKPNAPTEWSPWRARRDLEDRLEERVRAWRSGDHGRPGDRPLADGVDNFPPVEDPNPLLWLWERYESDPDMLTRFAARQYATRAYAWAVPDEEAIEEVAALGPILEVGAGRGYWARLISDAGGDVVATDAHPPADRFYPVEALDAEQAVRKYGARRTLMLVWPPYDDSMAVRALREYERQGGERVIYVGEGAGGCTGDDGLHAALGEQSTWTVSRVIDIPQWEGLHDVLTVYERGLSRNAAGTSPRPHRRVSPNAKVMSFPEKPPRVQIESRTYALSKVGVPITAVPTFDPPPDAGAQVVEGGGNPWKYIWVHEPKSDRLEMYRYSDGDWKVLGSSLQYPKTFDELRTTGQLNVVSPVEMEEFEAAMRRRSNETMRHLQEWWEQEKSDEQRRVDQLVAQFYRERMRPELDRQWADIARGVYPFDFVFNERLADRVPKEEQARMHAFYSTASRLGFEDSADSALETYVLRGLGYESYEDLEDPQALQWSMSDFLDQVAYPDAKRG